MVKLIKPFRCFDSSLKMIPLFVLPGAPGS